MNPQKAKLPASLYCLLVGVILGAFVTLWVAAFGCAIPGIDRDEPKIVAPIPSIQADACYAYLTNQLAGRDSSIIDLAELGQDLVKKYGRLVAWNCVASAYQIYSQGAPLDNATNVMWLSTQSPRVQDTAWMIHFQDQWLTKQ